MRKRREIVGIELIKQLLAELRDDPALPWSVYPCLEWPRRRRADGYGQIRIGVVKRLIHRLAYEVAIGPITDGLCVCHHCDNPPCFRPSHLFAGSHQDNMADCSRKGRTKVPHFFGEHHGQAKLTEGMVFEIRERYAAGGKSQQALANEYRVSQAAISLIVLGKKWKHLNEP